jgi:hypothetical protein
VETLFRGYQSYTGSISSGQRGGVVAGLSEGVQQSDERSLGLVGSVGAYDRGSAPLRH